MSESMFPPEVEQALSYTVTLSEIVTIIVIFDIAALLVLMFLERYDPRVFVTWLVMLCLAPPVGFILYMYLGATIYNRRKFTPKNITDTQLMMATEYQSNLLEGLGEEPDKGEMYRMAKCMEKSGAWSYSDDNDVILYTEGNEKLSNLLNDLRSAKKSILMEYYIIRNDSIGNELMDILTQKVREGVELRLRTDAFGIGKGPQEGIGKFRNAGGHYATFHSSLNLLLSPKKNNRNHRKIAIIDGKIAYCGGFNIGNEYQGEGPLGHWRDASVRVVGSGIIPMAVRFSADWQYCARKDPLKPIGHYLGDVIIPHTGNVRMQLVSGGPDTMPNNPVQMQYLAMIVHAKERLYITTPYLAPDESMILALANAAKSGVDVRIMIPDKKDHMFLFWNNMSYANALMKAGVRVWRYNDGFVHEKLIVMDDWCCSVGSANFDIRSFTLNFETNVMIYSEEITRQAADQFLADLERSTEYSCEEYDRRTVMMRVRIAISRHMILLA